MTMLEKYTKKLERANDMVAYKKEFLIEIAKKYDVEENFETVPMGVLYEILKNVITNEVCLVEVEDAYIIYKLNLREKRILKEIIKDLKEFETNQNEF